MGTSGLLQEGPGGFRAQATFLGLHKASEEAAQCGLETVVSSDPGPGVRTCGEAPVGPGARATPSDFGGGVRGQPHLSARDQGLRAPGGGLWNPSLQVSCSEGPVGWEGACGGAAHRGSRRPDGEPGLLPSVQNGTARVMRFQQLK